MKTKAPSVSFVKNMLFLPLCAFVLLNWFILINFCMWYSVKFCFVRYFQRMIACTECQVCVHWAFSKQQIFLFALIQTKFIWALQSKFSEEKNCAVLVFWYPRHWGRWSCVFWDNTLVSSCLSDTLFQKARILEVVRCFLKPFFEALFQKWHSVLSGTQLAS